MPWCGCGGCTGNGQGKSVVGSVRGAGHVAHLVQQEICQKLDPNWREWYRHVAAVFVVPCVPAVRWSA